MAKFQWVRVSNQSPCPVCRHPDWCCISADDTVCKCMRVEEGCYRSKEDENGATYYLHRLGGTAPVAPELPARPGPEAKRADADTLHAVYSALLARLALGKAQREALQQRGLTDEAIDGGGYCTLPRQGRTRIARELHESFGDKVLRVPGFVVKEGESRRYLTLRGPAVLIVPCRDREGRIVALKVRRDGEGGSRYVYVSSAGHGGPGPGSPVHVSLGTATTAELVRLTEGELKADIVQSRTGLPTISVPGASSWRRALDVLKELGCKTVRLAFDADAPDNPTVARALSSCADALTAAGFAVELERWEAADGKGLDDLFVAGKTPEVVQGDAVSQAVREILAAANAEDEPTPADELARLQDVLDAGGAEALFRDRPLMQALAELAACDPAGFAAARASIRGRVSVRDLDQALRQYRPKPTASASDGAGEYFEENGCVYRNVMTRDGPVPAQLCNFTARIDEDVVHDDGAEQTCHFALEGKLASGPHLPRIVVPAGEFAAMNWVVSRWGTRAIVRAGLGTKDHLRVALQLLSGEVPRRVVYGHLGWRQVGGAWVYLHGGGAIGTNGLMADIPVNLPDPLSPFRLPAPLAGEELIEAVRASLGLLRLGSLRVTAPLLAAVYRAVLGEADFALHVAGPTGCYKSEAAALAQQHFGAGLDARHLPGSWSSTGNALEVLLFVGKDALIAVDDFCPTGSVSDVQRYHREADRLLRGQGNRSGRQRLRPDATLRPQRPPRGLTLSTGEDVPRGQSLRARMWVIEVAPGDLGARPPLPNPALTACQRDASEGKYAAAMSGFLGWLAPRYEEVRGQLRAEAAELREQARGDGQHARTPGIMANLALGLRYLLDFAQEVGAVTAAERERLWSECWEGLAEGAARQADHVASAEPAGLFLRLLSAAVAAGCAHIANQDGDEPPEPQRWGWRREEYYVGEGTAARYKAQGLCVGWWVDCELYLEPEASYAAVQKFARDQGEGFAVTANTLRKRLNEKGLLASTDQKQRGKLTVRRTLQGVRRDVLHLAAGAFAPLPETGPSGPSGPESEDSDGGAGETRCPGSVFHNGAGAAAGPVSWAGSEQGKNGAAHETSSKTAANGPVGRLGRSAAGRDDAGAGVDVEQDGGWQEGEL